MAKVIAVIILAGLVGLIWFVGQKIVPSRPELVHHHATPVAEPETPVAAPPRPEPPIRDVIAEESKRSQPVQPPRTPFWTHTHGGPVGPVEPRQPPPHPAAQTLPQHHTVPLPAPRPRVIIRYRIKRMKCPVVPAYLPRQLNQPAPPPPVYMDDATWWRLHPWGY